MRTLAVVGLMAWAIASCSATSFGSRFVPALGAAGSGAREDAAVLAAPAQLSSKGNADLLTLQAPPPLPPVAGTKADLPFAACDVGKFCPVQARGEEDCGTLSLTHNDTTQQIPGNVLVLFDQSLSMQEAWGTSGQSKLQAARAAIANALQSLQHELTVGAIFFPTSACSSYLPSPPGGAVAPIDAPGQIAWQPAPKFLTAWAQHWKSLIRLGIGTPLQEAFDRADEAIANTPRSGALAVVVVTDGDPNCVPDPTRTMLPTVAPAERAQAWLADQGIKTYVVGLPGAAGASLLENVASAGGSMRYLLPDDPSALESQLEQIARDTIRTQFQSCSIDLMPATSKPAELRLLVVEAADGSKHHIAQGVVNGGGWQASVDGGHVDITGQLCTDARTGRFRAITFEYPCDPHVPPPAHPVSPQ